MIDGIITLGPFAVPRILLLFLLSASVAHLVLFFLLRKDRKRFSSAADSFSSMVIVFFISWRLSLILTHFSTVRQSPSALLYLPGGRVNILIGGLAAVLFLILSFRRKKNPASRPGTLLLLAGMTLAAALPIHLTALLFSGDSPGAAETLPSGALILEDTGGNRTALTVTGMERTIVNFWASWCPPCRAELPEFSRYSRDYDPQRVRLIAVNMTSTESSVKDVLTFMEDHSIEFPVLLDTDGAASRQYGIQSVPTTLVFDRDGTLVEYKSGAVDYPWLVKAGTAR